MTRTILPTSRSARTGTDVRPGTDGRIERDHEAFVRASTERLLGRYRVLLDRLAQI